MRRQASFQSSTARGDCSDSAILAACRRASARIFRASLSCFSIFMASFRDLFRHQAISGAIYVPMWSVVRGP